MDPSWLGRGGKVVGRGGARALKTRGREASNQPEGVKREI